jgi:REP element-mobilizing transposase RayT
MPQSLAEIYLHIVFSTKNRYPFLRDKVIRERMFAYLKGTCDGLKCPSIRTGGWEDHIHILCRFGRTIAVADLVKELKVASSTWVKEEFRGMKDFHWQLGYGAFSISHSQIPDVNLYIENQEEHHHRESFQDEVRRICALHDVKIDERYAWE